MRQHTSLMNRMKKQRRGAMAAFLCISMIPLLALFAFAVDYGFLLYVKTDLQRAADNAALAAVYDLLPAADGSQDLDKVRATVKKYVQENMGDKFTVRDEDIEIGRFDPKTIYSSVDLLDTGIMDTVRVTIHRSELANSSVVLYFSRIFDNTDSSVSASATAVLQKGRYLGPGADILPIAISTTAWNSIAVGDTFSVYGDGQMTTWGGDPISGNWGTVDIGANSNSSADIKDQVLNGIRQSDLDALYSNKITTTSEYIDSTATIVPNGDTGFSSGIKAAIDEEIGETKLVPIYSRTQSKGGALYFTIVGWGNVTIESTYWQGGQRSHLTVTRSFIYDKDIRPNPDLSDVNNVIDAVYTSPALVE